MEFLTGFLKTKCSIPWGFMDDWRVTVPPGPPVEIGAGLTTATGAGGGGIMFSTGRAAAEKE